MRAAAADGRLALSFLTVIPVRARHGELNRAAAYFPLVGALIGALGGGVRAGGEQLFGPTPATVLALIVMVAVTGGLHQDGLADTADGLGVRNNRERRLEVMRDSSIGAFGTLALIAWALLYVSAVASLDTTQALTALIAAGALGRWAALVHARLAKPARTDGLGSAFAPPIAALAVATVIAIAATSPNGAAAAAIAVAAATAAAIACTAFARHAVGGRTGDTLGATVAVTEVATLLALLAS